MKVAAFYSQKEIDQQIIHAVVEGARRCGEDATAYASAEYPEDPDCDVAIIFGIKGRQRLERYRAAGISTVLIDKGYDRRVEIYDNGTKKRLIYWRVSVNAHHPTNYLPAMKSPGDRWDELKLPMRPWKRAGKNIVIAGSSAKFHEFHGMDDPNAVAEGLAAEIGKRSDRKIIYRSKPSWKGAAPVPGAVFCDPEMKIEEVLSDAHVLVTYGSNACFEAMMFGVPCVILGDAVARPISSTSIDDVEMPRRAKDAERRQLLSDLAYAQWTVREHAAGVAWPHIRRHL